jgi:hypothetical protein
VGPEDVLLVDGREVEDKEEDVEVGTGEIRTGLARVAEK